MTTTDPTTTAKPDQLEAIRRRWIEREFGAVEHMEAYGALLSTSRLVGIHVDKTLARLGLTGSRHTLLFSLDAAPNRTLSIGQLSRRMLTHPTSITKLVDHLEAAGLVRKTVPEHDKRSIVVELTRKGVALIEKAGKVLTETKFGLGSLDQREVMQLSRALETVRGDLLH